MRCWDAFDDPSAERDRPTYQHDISVRRAGREVQPSAGGVAPVWAPHVDITEREDAGHVVELTGSDSGQFRRPLTVAQRVIEDSVEGACEGGAPRVAVPGSWPYGAAGR